MSLGYPCTLCCRPTTMWCSRCQRAWYCSPQHLQKDWPRHRGECLAELVTPLPSPSPTFPDTKMLMPQVVKATALLFVPEQDQPQLVTIDCRPPLLIQRGACPSPLIQEYFTESQPQSVVLTKGLNGDALRFPLHLFFCPLALARGSPVNRAIARITSGAASRPWTGTTLVLRFNGTRKQGYADASLNDLPTLSAYFLGYH